MTRLRIVLLFLALTSAAGAQSGSNCPVVDIQPAGTVEGELSRPGCFTTGVMVWESPDTLIRQYRFTTTQSGVLSVELYSSAYSPAFFVLGPQGNRIMYQADYTHISFARSTVSLSPGTYTIAATSYGPAAGAFRLTTKFAPLGECAIRDLAFGGVISGDFAKPVCRVLDLQMFSTNAAGAERFRITVQERGIVTVNVTSALNDSGYISARLYDSANREVAGARQEIEGSKLTLLVSLTAGSYVLDLRAQPSFGTGAFTLTANFETNNQGQCGDRPLRFNVPPLDYVLNATGCRYMDLVAGSTDASVTDSYLVSPAARGVMGFTLSSRSSWFEADLLLLDRQKRPLATKPYGGGRPAVEILASVEPGNYYIYVRAHGKYVGEYSLGASFGTQRDCTPRALILGQAVSGELFTTGCRVVDRTVPSVDDSPQANYTVKVERSGLLTLELKAAFPLEAALRLLNPAGAVVSTAQAKGGANPARIEAGVSPGVYAIEVRGLGTSQSYVRTGSYILTTSVQDIVPRSCPARDLALNDTVSAGLTAAGCRQLDVFPASSSTALLDPYRITLTEAGALTVEMVSADLDAFVSLYDKNLSLLGSDNNSGGGKSARLMTSLNPGTYFIHASAADAKPGTYNLTVLFRPASAPACPPANLALVGSAAGRLSASDCRVLDLVRPSSNTAYVDRYRVTLPQRGVLSLDLASPDFTPWVAVYDSRSSQLGSAFGSTRSSAKLSVSLNAGEYLVWASSSGAQAGVYTLQSLFRAMVGAGCVVTDLAPGATAQGSLGDLNCRMLDLVAPSSDPSLVSLYRITAPRRSVLTLEMESPSLAPALRLNDAESRMISSNQTQRGSIARIVATVDPAPYIVYASSAGAGGFTFRSRLQDAPAPDCAARALGLSDTAAGTFDQGGCRGKDIVPNSADHSYAAQYKLVVAERATVGVEMNSSAFTPQVALYRLNFSAVAFSASAGVSGRSLLSATVNPGEYILVARSSGLTTGAFTLKTSFQTVAPLSCPVGEIGLEQTVEGTLAAGDCALSDILPDSASDAFVHRYQVAVTAGGTLQIELSSADFVPVVSLRDAEGQTVAEATVAGEEAGARFSAGVTPGTYVIFVTSARPASGRYTVKTAFQPAEGEPEAGTTLRR
jgi:hypothetical protein